MNNKDRKFFQDEDELIYDVPDYFVGKRKTNSLQEVLDKEHSETSVHAESFSIVSILELEVNQILDLYNDYMTLYAMFKDLQYKAKAFVFKAAFTSKLQAEGGELT